MQRRSSASAFGKIMRPLEAPAFRRGEYHDQREQYWDSVLTGTAETAQYLYVAENDARAVVGFACGAEREGDTVYTGELYAIYLLAEHQKQGIGRALTRAIAQSLRDAGINSMLVWVLAQNPVRSFYEALGGKYLREKPITIGGATLSEVAYRWRDLHSLINLAS